MISDKRIFVCFLVACFHYCAAKSTQLRIDFEDCGSVLEPYRIALGSCYDVPCGVERGKVVNIEVEFNPNDSPSPINTLRFDGIWLVDGIYHVADVSPSYCNFVNCLSNSPNGLYRLSAGVLVPDLLPKMFGYLQIKTYNYFDGGALMCYRIPVYIY